MSVRAMALSVCADPNYLPFSNRAGVGFENKIAEAVAKALGETVDYTWASYRGHGGFPQFLSSTLDAKKCDVVMSIPYGSREELTTRPYYTSSYVFVFLKSKKYDIAGMDSPTLRRFKAGESMPAMSYFLLLRKKYDIAGMDSPALKRLKVGFERDTPAED